MNDYYCQQLEKGQEYQDFIADQLWEQKRFHLRNYTSRHYQLNVGENAQGIEIKLDINMKQTGNLYIEVAERRDLCMPFVRSGIYNGQAQYYLIGDYERGFLFGINNLKRIHESNRYEVFTIKRNTSQGFLLPIADARKNRWMIEELLFNSGKV